MISIESKHVHQTRLLIGHFINGPLHEGSVFWDLGSDMYTSCSLLQSAQKCERLWNGQSVNDWSVCMYRFGLRRPKREKDQIGKISCFLVSRVRFQYSDDFIYYLVVRNICTVCSLIRTVLFKRLPLRLGSYLWSVLNSLRMNLNAQ